MPQDRESEIRKAARPKDYTPREGRPQDLVRAAWTDRYRLSERRRRMLTDAFMSQLSCCKSDEARRLLLGMSR